METIMQVAEVYSKKNINGEVKEVQSYTDLAERI